MGALVTAHLHLLDLLKVVERLASDATKDERQVPELRRSLMKLQHMLEAHFNYEESVEFHTQLSQEYPRTAGTLGRLLAQHRELREGLRGLVGAPQTVASSHLASEALAFVEALRAHEAEESATLQAVYGDDLGAMD